MPTFKRDKDDTAPFAKVTTTNDYPGRLGYIGRQLDEDGCRSVTIAEITGNFILRATYKRRPATYVSEVVQEDFKRGHARLPFKPQPSTYEAMFKVIGHDLEDRIAANVAIVERRQSFEMVGWERGTTYGQIGYVMFNHTYARTDLQARAEAKR